MNDKYKIEIQNYSVDGNSLLNNIIIELIKGKVHFLTGMKDSQLYLIGGILARHIPLQDLKIKEWPQLRALVNIYTGQLTCNDSLHNFKSVVYINSDPDCFFFASKVKEEMLLRGIEEGEQAKCLGLFKLDESFIERKISCLSGGEKVKVALSIGLYKKNIELYVFQGVIPWLDNEGRQLLWSLCINKVNENSQNKCNILFLEHEFDVCEFNKEYSKGKNIVIQNLSSRNNNNERVVSSMEELSEIIPATQSIPGGNISANANKTIIEFNNVRFKEYKTLDVCRKSPIIDSVTYEFKGGCLYAIVGDNGVGKSTFLKLAFGIIKPDSGNILFNNINLSSYERRDLLQKICYVGQFPAKQMIFGTAEEYKKKVGINELNDLLQDITGPTSLLSVAQMRLLLVAAYVTDNTLLIILDEPTWGTDLEDLKKLKTAIDTIRRIRKENLAIILVTHNSLFAKYMGATIIKLSCGKFE